MSGQLTTLVVIASISNTFWYSLLDAEEKEILWHMASAKKCSCLKINQGCYKMRWDRKNFLISSYTPRFIETFFPGFLNVPNSLLTNTAEYLHAYQLDGFRRLHFWGSIDSKWFIFLHHYWLSYSLKMNTVKYAVSENRNSFQNSIV